MVILAKCLPSGALPLEAMASRLLSPGGSVPLKWCRSGFTQCRLFQTPLLAPSG